MPRYRSGIEGEGAVAPPFLRSFCTLCAPVCAIPAARPDEVRFVSAERTKISSHESGVRGSGDRRPLSADTIRARTPLSACPARARTPLLAPSMPTARAQTAGPLERSAAA